MLKHIGLLLTLSLFACGRDEILDKRLIETYLDNPYDIDEQPLASYKGRLKAEIVTAKNLLIEMGSGDFPPIYVRTGNGDDKHLALCSYGELYDVGSRITIYPDSFKSRSPDAMYRHMVELLLHERTHCELHIAHDNSGIMHPHDKSVDMPDSVKRIKKCNKEHGQSLDLGAYTKAYYNFLLTERNKGKE